MKRMGVTKQRARIRRNAKRASILAVLAVLLSGCGGLSANRDESAPAASTAISAAAQDQNPAAANGAAASDSASQQAGGAPAEGKADGAQLPSADSLNGSAALVASPESRKIIYTANLTLQVEKYAEAQARIEEAVSRSGGYVLQFNENETSYEKSGSFVIKVPATGFNSLLSQLEAVSPSAKKSMQGQDVSEEYVDLTSRLKAK